VKAMRLLTVVALVGTVLGGCSGAQSRDRGDAVNQQRPAPTTEAAPAPASDGAVATAGTTPTFDSARAWDHLRKQVALGPRPSGSAALDECRKYILAQLKASGIDATQQVFMANTPLGEMMMANIIGTIPGRRSERIVLTSHYDTKRAPNFRFVGASDGASSTAALLELGRVLKGRQNEFTIELLFVDGEEAVNWDWRGLDNTYGSRYYVAAAEKAKTIGSLKAMILLDMVGAKNLLVKRDANSTPWLVDIVWDAAGRLGYRSAFSNELGAVEDDHIAFLRAGVPSVDIIDLDHYAQYWHTPQDDLNHVDARSLQIVGDVVVAAIPEIEKRLTAPR